MIAEIGENFGELFFGILLCLLQMLRREDALLHRFFRLQVEFLLIGGCPAAFFKESGGASFIDEVFIKQFDWGQLQNGGRAVGTEPICRRVVEIDAQA